MKERQRYMESERGERERAPFLCESLGKINPVRGEKNILCNNTLASPSRNDATFICYSQVSDKCLQEMEKLSFSLCFISACVLFLTNNQHTHTHARTGARLTESSRLKLYGVLIGFW